ncbi:hypothetical protein MYCTH_2306528 [Thermothelomyces thermophilus ATCC 42464]|uniref:RING-type domain-containing protein n=1 Tax=Thermothelomyces thermophilus (strain ATCC 42464 / BCRC 31852 / DSM 1799) TaxID=573729 RepID=G2QHJ7_THET4|nr:uncharacterized protein MYCTH_2306528 [Thermothelomyces thermophilus ATCC 42464]AEO58857.1 hypothetical protein MYCTH_2306528 [Thermothelomyces thermophilus ATCC 42464]
MATQYEVEHNIKPAATAPRRRRQIDMSTFNAHLHNLLPDSSSSASQTAQAGDRQEQQHPRHHNPHAVPNPSDTSALFRLIQDQMGTLATTAPTESNRAFLQSLVEALELDVAHPPRQIEGVSQEFLDGLDRVPRRALRDDDVCPICAERYLDDPYCLVVELPCHASHRFDLECVGPWLRGKGTCPMCRKELGKRKEVVVAPKRDGEGGEEDEDDEDDDMNGLYA